MAWDLIFWVLCFLISLALVASTFYQIICLTDLEADYLNPFETASRVNSLILPEFVLQGVLAAFFLLTWHWFMFLIVVPLTCYHTKLYVNRQHFIDVTEVFRGLSFEKKLRYIKLGIYLVLFIIVIFRLTLSAFSALTGDEDLVNIF